MKCLCPYRHLEPSKPGHIGPYDFVERLSKNFGVEVPKDKAMAWFFELVRFMIIIVFRAHGSLRLSGESRKAFEAFKKIELPSEA
jgi:hypothetical protein